MYIRGSATTSRRALRPTTRDSPQVYTYGYIYTYILKIYIYIYIYIYISVDVPRPHARSCVRLLVLRLR